MSELGFWAKQWVNSMPHRWHVRRTVPKFMKLAPDSIRGEVLEVGAGHGWTSRRLLEEYPQVALTTVDSNSDAVAALKKFEEHYGERLHVVDANAYDLPFDRESFDIVLSLYALAYFDDEEKAVMQMLRVLRVGGLLGIMDVRTQSVQDFLEHEGCEIVHSSGRIEELIWVRKLVGNKERF